MIFLSVVISTSAVRNVMRSMVH